MILAELWEQIRPWLTENRDALQGLQALVDVLVKVFAVLGGGVIGWAYKRRLEAEIERLSREDPTDLV